MPSELSARPSSDSEQIMPLLATPRSSAGLIVRFTAGRWAPTVATATWMPARTLLAPQTICRGSAAPTATRQTLNLSAFGWGSRVSTKPTTTPAAPAPTAAAPPADPEDWSSELARLDLELRRLGWSREQEGEYLQRAFGHPSRSRLTNYADLKAYLASLEGLPPGAEPASSPVPLRRRDLLAQSDQLLVALGWNGEQGRRYLEQQLGVASRQLLADSQLLHFNMLLEGELLVRDPTGGTMGAPSAPAP